jgi:hypothetical protein
MKSLENPSLVGSDVVGIGEANGSNQKIFVYINSTTDPIKDFKQSSHLLKTKIGGAGIDCLLRFKQSFA